MSIISKTNCHSAQVFYVRVYAKSKNIHLHRFLQPAAESSKSYGMENERAAMTGRKNEKQVEKRHEACPMILYYFLSFLPPFQCK